MELERTVRHTLLDMGRQQSGQRPLSLRQSLDMLASQNLITPGVASGIKEFTHIRNEIVHGHYRASDDEILRAIDSGLIIYRAVAAIPREQHYVEYPDVAVYSDSECLHARSDCLGVI